MSSIKLSPASTGSAIFTIEAPATSTNRTLTLPDATGTVQVSGNPISGTTGTFTGLVDISAAGAGQIKFPATQNASTNANTLDDYEEGTWTPTLSFSSGSVTYNSRNGVYIKVGKLVTLNFWVYGASISFPSGGLTMTGLPFAAVSSEYRPSSALRVNQITVTGQVMVWINSGSSVFELIAMNNGTPTQLNATAISGANFEFGGSISYVAET